MKKIVIGAIKCYRILLSPMLAPACRFHPTCSEYAQVAISRYGVAQGGFMAVKRILRCHPFHAGGFDPVP